ncbi:MAG: ATPase [Candidatus Staskawiczbacteria bacterium RIFCSPHIGHO2_02_FULL_42_22]|uniref:ATPase n=1 Tax=Candidatus Staskawiczbacteria bacterium RIFCSPHIGHO2_02_FULL_42_22 TaxID=1802207 RepID=A0A1G2I3S8_9BACT|nr:MAG: ATPase [Candidatus Staskawiczbacteria bacterium RIFCSPHIGHO2_02_FULL_42_22]
MNTIFPHTLSVPEVIEALQTNTATGLSSQETQLRLEKFGPNQLVAAVRVSPFALLLGQFKNSLIIILLAATVFSGVLGHTVEAIAIGVIILFSVILGFVQEFRAGRAMEALSKLASPTALVFRDGLELEILAGDIVPGDIIIISTGDRFPADARLIKKTNLKADEALLTGESLPVEKESDMVCKKDAALGDQRNMVFAGTSCSYGRGLAVVTTTGMQTEFGRIAGMLESVKKEETPLEKNLDDLVRSLTKVAFVVVTIVVLLGVFRGQPLLEMIIFGIALAVAVVPEALPAVVTISLAIGVQRMIRRHALVRHLPAVETLGCTSIICSDKTGTITKDEMTVKNIFVDGKVIMVGGSGYEPVGEFLFDNAPYPFTEAFRLLLQSAVLASDARVLEKDGVWHINGDPTEGALIVAAQKAGIKKEILDEQFVRLAEISFTSESKRMTVLCQGKEETAAYSKGAPEILLQSCNRHYTNDGVQPLTKEMREAVLGTAHQFAGQALRVIGVAFAPADDINKAQHDMIFLGLFGMIDPPRSEAKPAIALCRQAGIKLMMITGDHPLTAKAIATQVGLLSEGGRVITGSELFDLTDDELEEEVDHIVVAARVSPEHKLRIVQALQKHGHIVAMTGDGVNDAPAIKKANIGIAMGIAGTDVSREAAAMTLVDDNFASIVAAVEEGRIIFDNIKKYLMYLLSSNIGEIGLMVAASLVGLPLPLSAVQILYVNLATDGLPALALAMDPPSHDVMKKSPRKLDQGIFTRSVVLLMVVGGAWSALVNVLLFAWSLRTGYTLKESMALVFVSLILIQFFKAYNFRSDKNSVLRRPFANHWLNMAIAWELLILILVIYIPFLQIPFKTHSFSYYEWLLVVGIALTIIPVLEATKWFLRKKTKNMTLITKS